MLWSSCLSILRKGGKQSHTLGINLTGQDFPPSKTVGIEFHRLYGFETLVCILSIKLVNFGGLPKYAFPTDKRTHKDLRPEIHGGALQYTDEGQG